MPTRDYQEDGLQRTIANLDHRPLVTAPTGSGKTFIGVELIRRLNIPTLWLAHRTELIDQAAQHLIELGMMPQILGKTKADARMLGDHRVWVGSIQTARNRKLPPIHLIVLDEAHHAPANTFTEVLNRAEGARIMGLTATPFRLDGRGLGDIFNELIVVTRTSTLVENGWLINPRVYSQPPDMTGVSQQRGDYVQKQADAKVNNRKLIGDIVTTWHKRAEGARTIVYANSLDHSKQIRDAFIESGVTAEHVDAYTPKLEREAILERLRHGETTIVCNKDLFTEGYDLPSLECGVIARPTASLALHLQMGGRFMRKAEGKTSAVILDHAGNFVRHGPLTRDIEYSLAGAQPKEDPGLKTCPACFLMVERGTLECPACHADLTAKKNGKAAKPLEHEQGDLVEYGASFEEKREYWLELEAQREQLGQTQRWVFDQFMQRFGLYPVILDGDLVDPEKATKEQKRRWWLILERKRQDRGHRPGWTFHRYHECFGVWPHRDVADRIGDLNDRWERQFAAPKELPNAQREANPERNPPSVRD